MWATKRRRSLGRKVPGRGGNEVLRKVRVGIGCGVVGLVGRCRMLLWFLVKSRRSYLPQFCPRDTSLLTFLTLLEFLRDSCRVLRNCRRVVFSGTCCRETVPKFSSPVTIYRVRDWFWSSWHFLISWKTEFLTLLDFLKNLIINASWFLEELHSQHFLISWKTEFWTLLDFLKNRILNTSWKTKFLTLLDFLKTRILNTSWFLEKLNSLHFLIYWKLNSQHFSISWKTEILTLLDFLKTEFLTLLDFLKTEFLTLLNFFLMRDSRILRVTRELCANSGRVTCEFSGLSAFTASSAQNLHELSEFSASSARVLRVVSVLRELSTSSASFLCFREFSANSVRFLREFRTSSPRLLRVLREFFC